MADKDTRDINPTAKGDGAQAGGGPHVGAAEGSVTGVLGMGSSSVGHPTGGMGSGAAEGDDRPVEGAPGKEPGVIEERNVSVLGSGPAAAREARVLDQGAGPSSAAGAAGSGSSTDVPGGSGRFASDDARVGGLQTPGGPSRDSDPAAQANVRGAGSERGDDR